MNSYPIFMIESEKRPAYGWKNLELAIYFTSWYWESATIFAYSLNTTFTNRSWNLEGWASVTYCLYFVAFCTLILKSWHSIVLQAVKVAQHPRTSWSKRKKLAPRAANSWNPSDAGTPRSGSWSCCSVKSQSKHEDVLLTSTQDQSSWSKRSGRSVLTATRRRHE